MKGSKKRGKKNNSHRSLGVGLVIILILCILSVVSNLFLLIQKLTAIFTVQVQIGVYVSATLLLSYCVLMTITIFSILKRKRYSIKNYILTIIVGAIFLIWYYFLSSLIYHQYSPMQLFYNCITVVFNLGITILIAFYLMKSKKVKQVLIK